MRGGRISKGADAYDGTIRLATHPNEGRSRLVTTIIAWMAKFALMILIIDLPKRFLVTLAKMATAYVDIEETVLRHYRVSQELKEVRAHLRVDQCKRKAAIHKLWRVFLRLSSFHY